MLQSQNRVALRGGLAGTYAPYENLYIVVAVLIVFDSVANIKGLSALDVFIAFAHIEGDAVDDTPRCAVQQFQLQVFLFMPSGRPVPESVTFWG